MTQVQPVETPSPTSNGNSTVERLAAVPLPLRRVVTHSSTPSSSPPHAAQDPRENRINAKIAHNGQIIAVIGALSRILSVRVYLFFVLIGAFILGLIAAEKETYVSLAVLVAYCALTVLPLCILDDRLHRRPDDR